MKVIGEYSVCGECLQAIANDDYFGLDYYYTPETATIRQQAIKDGMQSLGPGLIAGGTDFGFCRTPCDCCGDKLHGNRYQVIQLGN